MAIHLGRREFITLLGGAAVGCRAQVLARISESMGTPILSLGIAPLLRFTGSRPHKAHRGVPSHGTPLAGGARTVPFVMICSFTASWSARIPRQR
jgi:hypothetical protein